MEARYDNRLQDCKSQDEMAEYLLSCFSIIKEYTEDAEETETSHRALGVDVKMRKGTQRKAIYKKYMNEIEGEYETADYSCVQRYNRPCAGCGAMFTKFVDEIVADEICQECGRATTTAYCESCDMYYRAGHSPKCSFMKPGEYTDDHRACPPLVSQLEPE